MTPMERAKGFYESCDDKCGEWWFSVEKLASEFEQDRIEFGKRVLEKAAASAYIAVGLELGAEEVTKLIRALSAELPKLAKE